MTFWGLALVAAGVYSGMTALSEGLDKIAGQMVRKNQLREAELRAKGIAFGAAEPDEPESN